MNSNSDIAALRRELANRTLSPSELLERYLQAIGKHQPELNCYVSVDQDAARRDAKASDARYQAGTPLSQIDGIPIALKDNMHVDGMVTHNGTNRAFDFDQEAEVAKKLRAAGAVLLGHLNMDECAIGATTDNPHHGRTHNPWRAGYIPGGSSGGAGAAVAGGLAMAALGTDTLGSVRLPAAYCGIVGLKPTLGLISSRGVVPLSPTLDHVGPLCLSVGDAALVLNILAGPAADDWSCEPVMPGDLAGLRIGVLEPIKKGQMTEQVAEGFERAKADIGANGGSLISVPMPELDFSKLRRAAFLIIEAEGADALAKPLHDNPQSFSEAVKAMFAYGRNAPRQKIDSARRYLAEIKATEPRVFSDVDLLISPTAPQTAFAFESPGSSNQADLTALANVWGGPAITIPSGLDAQGLPLSVQLMAPAYQETRLLSAALFMEGIWGTFSPDL